MTKKLNSLALGKAGAITAAISMLLLSIAAKSGIYTTAAEQMIKWHMFFDLSKTGIITGMFEAAVLTFGFIYLFGVIYNKIV